MATASARNGSLPLSIFWVYGVSLLLSAALLLGYWYWQGRPAILPDVAGVEHKLQCVSYSPFDKDQSPLVENFVLRPQRMDQDLALLATYFSCVRTYSMTGLEQLPQLAAKHGLKVMLGAWISSDPVKTREEIELLVKAANQYPDIVQSVIVGNEALLRKDISGKRLADLIAEVKGRVPQPVTYADVWEFWEKHPEVAPAVDFITIHLLPYWEDEPAGIDDALAKVTRVREHYQQLFAPKDIFIGETGWPSQGRQRQTALPSRINEAKFMRGFVTLAEQKGWHYNLIEAFDQPWKRINEGAVGGYWGLFDADRADKSVLAGPVSNLPDYPVWMATSVAVMALGLLLAGAPRDRRAAWLLPALAAVAAGCLCAWWVQAGYSVRNHLEWGWTIAVSALNVAVLAYGVLAMARRGGWRTRLFNRLEGRAASLLGLAGFLAAVISIQLAFDARYRLFSPCAILLPALVFLLLPARLPQAQGRLLTLVVGLSLPWLLWQEKLTNAQALAWVVTAALMAWVLYRAAFSPGFRRQPAVAASAAMPR